MHEKSVGKMSSDAFIRYRQTSFIPRPNQTKFVQ